MRRIIYLALVWVFFACNEEEFITERGYPFLESLGITDLNDTGVTINFEIKNYGKNSIQEYGIQYIESEKLLYGVNEQEYYKVIFNQAPTEPLISIRIDNNLVSGVNYLARPYVKSGGKIIFGEELVFDSKGVAGPVIHEVSDSELTQSSFITITGENFNLSRENLEVRIPGLENIFQIDILEHTATEINLKVWIKSNNYPLPQSKYDLIVSSGGKVTRLSQFFSVVLPEALSLSKNEVFVGQEFDVILNKLTSLDYLDFKLISSTGDWYFNLKVENLENNVARLFVENMPPGTFYLSIEGPGFKNVSQLVVKVKNSWVKFKSDFPISSLYNWSWVGVGDEMLFWSNVEGDFQKFYSVPLESSGSEVLPAKPDNDFYRSYGVQVTVENRYLYIGLGNSYGLPPLIDFARFDAQTRTWEKLKDYPFEKTDVEKSFYFNGKIYIILYGESNFATYEIASNSWAMTTYGVPDDLRGTLYQDSDDKGVYYVPRDTNILYRYEPGIGKESIAQYSGYYSSGGISVKVMGDQIFLFHGPYEYFRVDLNTRQAYPIQTFKGEGLISGVPWVTTKGLMLAFPKNQNDVDMSVYRWVAGD